MKRNSFLEEIRKEIPEETRRFVEHNADIVIRVNELLEEKGWTQKRLSDNMAKKPSEISKWLKGEHNFTLRSLSKLEVELGASIIHVARTISPEVGSKGSKNMTVHRTHPKDFKGEFKKAAIVERSKKENPAA